MPDKLPDSVERMIREVGVKQRRIEVARGSKDSFWDSIGVLGVVGWSVSVPTLLGVVAGVWIDRRFPSRFSWALMLLFAGLSLGCINAWIQGARIHGGGGRK
jgi:ATP synthase protein I